MREIEIKLKVKNLEDLENKLIENGLKIYEEVKQHDIIYTNANNHNNFNNTKEGHIVLRIRKEGSISKMTLKKEKTNEMDNLEYETGVSNPEETHQIFLALGWTPEVEVKKIRKKGKIGDYELCLDKVERLGDFIELEKITEDDDDPQKVRKELFDVLRPFGFSEADEETKGYDTQIYNLYNN